MAKKASGKANAAKSMTKSAVFQHLADETKLNRKQIAAVFASLHDLIKKELTKKSGGVFTVPGLVKFTVKKKDAVPAGQRMDPFTKQMKHFAAKPASKRVRARALKGLNDMVNT